MANKKIRSRIKENFSAKLLEDMYRICNDKTISDNNIKIDGMIGLLKSYNLDFVELGPGTNRLAILIDGYVFKIAMDKWGMQDNLNEFTTSQELQPYVTKVYECNELMSVHEYVTVISREEFIDKKPQLQSILAIIAEGYLLGDVGTVAKNFANWGYRDDGSLVILDFAYIYRIRGDEMLCSYDQSILEYDENFHTLRCPDCRRKYSFTDVRRKVTLEHERKENEIAKQLAYKLTEPVLEIQQEATGYNGVDEDEFDKRMRETSASLYKNLTIHKKQEEPQPETKEVKPEMKDQQYIPEDEQNDSYLAALELMKRRRNKEVVEEPVSVDNIDVEDDKQLEPVVEAIEVTQQLVEVERDEEEAKSTIRVFTQTATGVIEDSITKEEDDMIGDLVIDVQNGSDEEDEEEEETPHTLDLSRINVNIGPINDEAVNEATEEILEEVQEEIVVGHTTEEILENVEDEINNEETEVVEGEIVDDEDECNEVEVHVTSEPVNITVKTDKPENIIVTNTVTVTQVPQEEDEEAEALRRELEADLINDENEDRINELASEYQHLEEDEEDRWSRGKHY